MGWALASVELPVVEYRVWPMARLPGDDVQRLLIEDTINETESTIEVEFLIIVRSGDAGAFLAAMLE